MTRAHRLSFLKVLAAMAWADGEVQKDERNRIKVLFNRFDLDPGDRREVDALLDLPVPFDRALELTKDFAGRIAPPGARKELLAELEAMTADGGRTPEEAELLEHVRSILSSHTVVDGLFEKMRGLFSRTLLSGRDPGASGSLTEYAHNKALRRLQDLARERGEALPGDPPDWNRITLLGVLLAHVARLGSDGTRERAVLDKTLAGALSMSPEQRELLSTVIEEEAGRDTDLRRICAEFSRVSTTHERLDIIDALFAIGAADERISRAEVELIREIADLLWISNPEYLSVRDAYRDRIET